MIDVIKIKSCEVNHELVILVQDVADSYDYENDANSIMELLMSYIPCETYDLVASKIIEHELLKQELNNKNTPPETVEKFTPSEAAYEMDDNEMNELVYRHYPEARGGKYSYEFACDEECGNGTAKTYMMKKSPLSVFNLESIKNMRNKQRYSYITRTLLQDMVNRDIIPEGKYIIKADW